MCSPGRFQAGKSGLEGIWELLSQANPGLPGRGSMGGAGSETAAPEAGSLGNQAIPWSCRDTPRWPAEAPPCTQQEEQRRGPGLTQKPPGSLHRRTPAQNPGFRGAVLQRGPWNIHSLHKPTPQRRATGSRRSWHCSYGSRAPGGPTCTAGFVPSSLGTRMLSTSGGHRWTEHREHNVCGSSCRV